MPWNTTITNTGNTMLQQWATSGETLTVTRANCGNGTVSTSALAAQTALTGTIGDLIIAGKQEVTAGTQYTVQIGPSATGEYTLRQVGLWARLGSGTEGLLAIYQNAEGINVPSQATEPGFLHTLFLTVAMSNQGQLVVQFSAGAYVTHADLPLSVANGGTGATSLASGRALIGNGTNTVTTRPILDTSSDLITPNSNLVTARTLVSHVNTYVNFANLYQMGDSVTFANEMHQFWIQGSAPTRLDGWAMIQLLKNANASLRPTFSTTNLSARIYDYKNSNIAPSTNNITIEENLAEMRNGLIYVPISVTGLSGNTLSAGVGLIRLSGLIISFDL